MPKLWPVLSQAFTGIFTRLGIQAVPAGPQWWLSDTIVPVALLDSDITLQANVIERVETVVTLGAITNPAAGSILASTGALAAGNFKFRVFYSVADGTTGNAALVQHRDAADAANVFQLHIESDPTTVPTNYVLDFTIAMAANERLRVLSRVLGTGRYQATIFQTRLS